MVRYDIPKTVKGDTFDGVLFTVTLNSTALDLTNAVIKMDLRLIATDTPPVLSLTSVADAGLTILVPETDGKFKINEQVIDINAGIYKYDVEITFPDNTVRTYFGGNWEIIQDVTYDG